MFDFGILIARMFLGVPFIIWGVMKLRGGDEKLVPVLAGLGLHDAKGAAFMVGVCELVGGITVVLGFFTALFALPLGLWCLVTAWFAHRGDMTQLLSHSGMAGGFFALTSVGGGLFAFT